MTVSLSKDAPTTFVAGDGVPAIADDVHAAMLRDNEPMILARMLADPLGFVIDRVEELHRRSEQDGHDALAALDMGLPEIAVVLLAAEHARAVLAYEMAVRV